VLAMTYHLRRHFSIFAPKCENDPSVLPAAGDPLVFGQSSEKEHRELADALLENTTVTYLELQTENYTKYSAEAMAKYVRTSKSL
jgi:hypothetical protein